MNRTILLLILAFFAINANAQTFNETFRNDEFKVNQFTGDLPTIFIMNNKDDDTIWVSYVDLSLENSKIISLDKDLNITSSTFINYRFRQFPLSHKINNLFYRVSNNDDTVFLKSFDRNGNNIMEKALWIKNHEDSLWVGQSYLEHDYKFRYLSNNNFLLVASAKYPSNPDEFGCDAIKLILFDTLGNVLNTKTYPLKCYIIRTNICEVGEHLLLEKNPTLVEEGNFSYLGLSYINKETLEIEDSIPRTPFTDTLPSGIIDVSYHSNYIIALNDTLFAGLHYRGTGLRMDVYNKNTKEIINSIRPSQLVDGLSLEYDENFSSDRFVFNNTDSIYTHYQENGTLKLLNINANGDINFQYKLSFPTHGYEHRQVQGMKITENGELIISLGGHNFHAENRAINWLIKFNPKGLVNLTNVETGERESIRVYPNPAKDYIEVDIEAERFSSSEIELFDMQGRMVKRAKLAGRKGNRIDVSSLPPGAYTYSVTLNEKAFSGKIIIGN